MRPPRLTYSSDEQRREAGWIGVQKRGGILSRTLITAAAVALCLGTLGLTACDATPECAEICSALLDDCAFDAWTSYSQCTRGCEDELFRHGARDEIVECYREAGAACSADQAVACRLLGDQIGAEGYDPDE